MMRFLTASILAMCMLASFAYAELPTKTTGQGGWFALGGVVFPPDNAGTYCGGLPCTDTNFANTFGPAFSSLPPGPSISQFYETRNKAEDAVKSGEFGLQGQTCQPGDSGQAAVLVSGFARYYTLKDFTFGQLSIASPMPSSEGCIMDFTNAINIELNNQNLGNLAMNSMGPLISSFDGQTVDMANFQGSSPSFGPSLSPCAIS